MASTKSTSAIAIRVDECVYTAKSTPCGTSGQRFVMLFHTKESRPIQVAGVVKQHHRKK